MKTNKITDNLIQLTKFGFMNAYLVREEDGFTLIDTTMGGADALMAAAEAAGAPIKRIALTHGHTDHAGSVDGLREKLGASVPVLLTEADAAIQTGAPVLAPATKRGGWPKLKTPTDALHPGDRIGSLEVIATPGHTPGHVAFLDTRDRTLIAGDTFASIGGLAVPNHFKLRFPLPYGATCDRNLVLTSAQQLRALEPAVLALGHGRVISGPGGQMDTAIATAMRRAPKAPSAARQA